LNTSFDVSGFLRTYCIFLTSFLRIWPTVGSLPTDAAQLAAELAAELAAQLLAQLAAQLAAELAAELANFAFQFWLLWFLSGPQKRTRALGEEKLPLICDYSYEIFNPQKKERFTSLHQCRMCGAAPVQIKDLLEHLSLDSR